MSNRAWGDFELYRGATADEKVHFSFLITVIAAENLIGIRLGWNVSRDFLTESQGMSSVVPYELTDNPLTNVAETLFAGNNVAVSVRGLRIDSGERLDSRMARVQRFIESALALGIVKAIVFHVDSGFGEERTVEIAASDLKDALVRLYGEGQLKNFTPTIKFIIGKQ